MEKTYWVLTHKETGNILHQSIAETIQDCVNIACVFLNCTVQELEEGGHIAEQVALVKKPK